MTKFTDFHNLKTGKNGTNFASLLVTKTFLWFKQSKREIVYRPEYSSFYRWLDTGESCPGDVVDRLAQSYDAKEELEGLLYGKCKDAVEPMKWDNTTSNLS